MDKASFKEKLSTVDTSSLVDKVEMKLIDLFMNKGLKVGDALPKEVELAEILGVSRTVIREAMLRLRMVGLIESKKHRGAVLTNPDLLSPLKKSLHPNILAEKTLRDIFEMRLVLELGMADLLFARVTAADIEALEEIVETEPVKADSTIFNITDEIAFHGKLYEISGNQTLKDFQHMLLPVFQYVHTSGMLTEPVHSKSFISHRGLVDILKVGTPEVFRNAMRKHLDNHFSRLF
ncbi:FadR family transcriptional regulator [Olivibacter sp. SDN3]|uniref:FadR/GntR family transcriptional regulator n=1 Tax=Olivibacter sp. SDN3 TaxID=2764720 RepID=UPI00165125FC|nr:FCD domain-containing protein [Olivibacter sp. SDN3]QNL52017.1 FadR family transcriptional regulator [Olivibacter sp. SDN3]